GGSARANVAAPATVQGIAAVDVRAESVGANRLAEGASRLAQLERAHLIERALVPHRALRQASSLAARLAGRAGGRAVAAVTVVRQDAEPAAGDVAPGTFAAAPRAACPGRPAASAGTRRVASSGHAAARRPRAG